MLKEQVEHIISDVKNKEASKIIQLKPKLEV